MAIGKEVESLNSFRPENDKYFTARVIAKMAGLYGERGTLAVGVYSYLRWVDDTIDLPGNLSVEEKMAFLENQKKFLNGETSFNDASPMEREYLNLPWHVVGKGVEIIKQKELTIIDSMKDDLDHMPSKPRKYEEIKEYYLKIFLQPIEILNLTLNGTELETSQEFKELLASSVTIISLKDFAEDIGRKMLQVGFTDCEVEKISDLSPEERMMEALYTYDISRFESEKRKALNDIQKRKNEFLNLNIPWWQKALCVLYMDRALIKGEITVQYPKDEVGKLKHIGLKAKAQRLIREDRSLRI